MAIRNRVYGKLGASRARQVLAAGYPGGSARSEIRRRVLARSEDGDSKQAMIGAIIEEISNELVDASKKAQKAEANKRIKIL